MFNYSWPCQISQWCLSPSCPRQQPPDCLQHCPQLVTIVWGRPASAAPPAWVAQVCPGEASALSGHCAGTHQQWTNPAQLLVIRTNMNCNQIMIPHLNMWSDIPDQQATPWVEDHLLKECPLVLAFLCSSCCSCWVCSYCTGPVLGHGHSNDCCQEPESTCCHHQELWSPGHCCSDQQTRMDCCRVLVWSDLSIPCLSLSCYALSACCKGCHT